MKKLAYGFILLFGIHGFAAEVSDTRLYDCRKILADQGFENLIVSADSNRSIYVQYENRVFRNEMMAAGVVAAALSEKLTDTAYLILTPVNRSIPICNITIPLERYREFVAGKLDDRAMANELKIEKGQALRALQQQTANENSSFGRIDLTVRPGTAFQLGNYDDRLKINLHLVPEASVMLWRGSRLLAQAIVPLYDEIGIYTDEVRLSRLVLNQWVALPGDGFASLSAGGFRPDRYGLAGEMAWYFLNRQVCLGSAAEYTGFLLYQYQKWNYSELSRWTYRGYACYNFSQIDLSISLQYAKYLMGDKGWQVEVTRIFGDAEIGVYAARTDQDQFGGVRLKIPLPPMRSARPARVRLVSPNYFQLGYQATNKVYTTGEPIATGIGVSTANDLLDLPKHLLPGYIRNNLQMWKKAGGYVR